MKNCSIFIKMVIFLLFFSCNNSTYKGLSNEEFIVDMKQQNLLFEQLSELVQGEIPVNRLNDSLIFLIVPLKESCPSCLNKTLDSILKHKSDLLANRLIVLSIKGGRKTINSYFRERNGELPTISGQLFLDSTNRASDFKLFEDNPVFYYTVNRKAYKKVKALPETVKTDLKNYFSGRTI
ncbi:hypothetical protein GFS24_21365 [Chitinophaga sp. SYP-B3965]|uniref:hypothetical protein n=1 Tax=Chitinophaga sp. SYP-B3965 TaxID=2663120 RepID=UPI00129954C4|nr:hypothetical protein [Chitinophaga sp. SYP-B3965]MRG47687.1 hypothetical protein [Chitinophaga sp. SYP-B3965]